MICLMNSVTHLPHESAPFHARSQVQSQAYTSVTTDTIIPDLKKHLHYVLPCASKTARIRVVNVRV